MQQLLEQLAAFFRLPILAGGLGYFVGLFEQGGHEGFVFGEAADLGFVHKIAGVAGDEFGAAGNGRGFHFDDDVKAAHGGGVDEFYVVAYPDGGHAVVFQKAVEPCFVEAEIVLPAVKQVFHFVKHQHAVLPGEDVLRHAQGVHAVVAVGGAVVFVGPRDFVEFYAQRTGEHAAEFGFAGAGHAVDEDVAA